jgi:hypothetical protein
VLTSGAEAAGGFLRGLPRPRPLPPPRLGGIPSGGIDAGGEESQAGGGGRGWKQNGQVRCLSRRVSGLYIWRGLVEVLGAGPAGQ